MHQNLPVLDITIDDRGGEITNLGKKHNLEHLPLGVMPKAGFVDRLRLDAWWENRTIPITRLGIKGLLHNIDVSTTQALITKNCGLSLSDQYWIKPINSDLKWEELNFFDNGFSEDFSKALLYKYSESKNYRYIYEKIELDLMTPDLTSSGQLPKKWKITGGGRYLFKGGTPPFRQEPFNEEIASIILTRMNIDHVPYEVTLERG
jgi:hypothetical protein